MQLRWSAYIKREYFLYGNTLLVVRPLNYKMSNGAVRLNSLPNSLASRTHIPSRSRPGKLAAWECPIGIPITRPSGEWFVGLFPTHIGSI